MAGALHLIRSGKRPRSVAWARHNARVSWLSEAWHRTAPARSDKDAEFLSRYLRFSRPLIVAAAVLPLVITAGRGSWAGIVIGVGSWLVFLLDYVIQSRTRANYLKSRFGLFDITVVILTSPWYLIPGVHGGALITLLRLARLFRVLVVFHGVKRLLERLGRAFLAAVIAVMLFSFMAYLAEHPVNPMFASYGDAVWWGVVTLTTVGYGDIVPITVEGRLWGVALMIAGLALLGVVAGSLASFFKLSPQEENKDEADRKRLATELSDDPESGEPEAGHDGHIPAPKAVVPPPSTPASSDDVQVLTQQVIDLRDELRSLAEHMGHPGASRRHAKTPKPPSPPGSATPGASDEGGG